MKNRFMTAALAVAISAAMVMPASASTIVTNRGSSIQSSNVQSSEKIFQAPGWLWLGPYCYYIANDGQKDLGTGRYNVGKILKNCTTPDGYQVDAEGRWIVDGVVQTNDFGNVKMGMAEKYTGKSNDEIWSLMKGALKDVWSQMYVYSGVKAYSESTPTFIQGHMDPNYNGQSYFYGLKHDTDIQIRIPGYWWMQAFYPNLSEAQIAVDGTLSSEIEKTIKIALGDNVGQEFFNYLKSYADNNFDEFPELVFDENGEIIYDKILYKTDGTAWQLDENGNIVKARPELNTGINSEDIYSAKPRTNIVVTNRGNGIEKIDLSAWQNRTTDYGKRFTITNDGYITIYF